MIPFRSRIMLLLSMAITIILSTIDTIDAKGFLSLDGSAASPSTSPSSKTSVGPTVIPSTVPSTAPSVSSSPTLSTSPSNVPSNIASNKPSLIPNSAPTMIKSSNPSAAPSISHAPSTSTSPSTSPSSNPSVGPTMLPSTIQSNFPTMIPTRSLSSLPSFKPSSSPTSNQSAVPSLLSSNIPSADVTVHPSTEPSDKLSLVPSSVLTEDSSSTPSEEPSSTKSMNPSSSGSSSTEVSKMQSKSPSLKPSSTPSSEKSIMSSEPSTMTSISPTFETSSTLPSSESSRSPSTIPSSKPSSLPSINPTAFPGSSSPTRQPSQSPSFIPSNQPSVMPSKVASAIPSSVPSSVPSMLSSDIPSQQQTSSNAPSPRMRSPTLYPSNAPSYLLTYEVAFTYMIGFANSQVQQSVLSGDKDDVKTSIHSAIFSVLDSSPGFTKRNLQNQSNNEAEIDNGDITNEDELDLMTYIRQLEISLAIYNMRIETRQQSAQQCSADFTESSDCILFTSVVIFQANNNYNYEEVQNKVRVPIKNSMSDPNFIDLVNNRDVSEVVYIRDGFFYASSEIPRSNIGVSGGVITVLSIISTLFVAAVAFFVSRSMRARRSRTESRDEVETGSQYDNDGRISDEEENMGSISFYSGGLWNNMEGGDKFLNQADSSSDDEIAFRNKKTVGYTEEDNESPSQADSDSDSDPIETNKLSAYGSQSLPHNTTSDIYYDLETGLRCQSGLGQNANGDISIIPSFQSVSHVGDISYDPTARENILLQDDIQCPVAPSYTTLIEAETINRKSGHENNGFLSRKAGFLPLYPSMKTLPNSFQEWEKLIAKLPEEISRQTLRTSILNMPVLDANQIPTNMLQRASTILSILAHSYCHTSLDSVPNIPASILTPWSVVSRRLGNRKKPFMTYIDLIVYNWKTNIKNPINDYRKLDIQNMDLLVPTVNNQEEKVFYLTQVEILAKTSGVVNYIAESQNKVLADDIEGLKDLLDNIHRDLSTVQKSIKNIDPRETSSTYVDPIVWAKTVAPLAVPLEDGPPGPSGTSSPFFHMFDTFIDRHLYDSVLGKEALAIRKTFPKNWQDYINSVGEVSVDEYVQLSNDQELLTKWEKIKETYYEDILGLHKRKVFGYITHAFKTGRNNTIGGFEGNTRNDGAIKVDHALHNARKERMVGCPYPAGNVNKKPQRNKNNSHCCPDSFFTISRVIENNGVEDANNYFIANGVVYDATNFLDRHPGGASLISLCSGRDLSEELARVSHLEGRIALKLAKYAIGIVKEPNFESEKVGRLYVASKDLAFYLSEVEAIFQKENTFLKKNITSYLAEDEYNDYKKDLYAGIDVRVIEEFIPEVIYKTEKLLHCLEEMNVTEHETLFSKLRKLKSQFDSTTSIVKSSYLGFSNESNNVFRQSHVDKSQLNEHIEIRKNFIREAKGFSIEFLKSIEKIELSEEVKTSSLDGLIECILRVCPILKS